MTTPPGDGLFLNDATALRKNDPLYYDDGRFAVGQHEPRNPPSREFFVRQAILNAVEYWHPFYSRIWLRGCRSRDSLPPAFRNTIISEFRKLVSQYTPAHDLITREE